MRLIDADRLLTDRMKSKYYHLPNGDTAIPIIDIEHAPTIEPERPHGEWVEVKRYSRKGKRFLDCSVCHYGEKGEIVCEVTKLPNFCPNCGASMSASYRQVR